MVTEWKPDESYDVCCVLVMGKQIKNMKNTPFF